MRDYKARLIGTVAGLIVSSCVAHAETVQFLSTSFPVDTLTPVQGGQVKVTLGTQSLLTSSKDTGRKVAALYSGNALLWKRLDWSAFLGFVATAAENGERELVTTAIQSALSKPAETGQDVSELFARLSEKDVSASLFESSVTGFDGNTARPESVCDAFVYFREPSRHLAREKAPQLTYRFQFQCTQYLEKLAQDALRADNVGHALRALDTIAQVFADGSEQFSALVSARNKLSKLMDALNGGEYGSISRMVKALSDDAWLQPLAGILNKSLIDRAVQQALTDGKRGNALRIVAAIDFRQRTPRDHELVRKVLAEVTPQERDALVTPDVATTLRSFSMKDEGIKALYIKALTGAIASAIEAGALQAANPIMDQVLAVRPDPSPENDALRLQYIRRLLSLGAVAEAKDRAAEIQTALPIGLHIRLLVAGAYVKTGILLAVALAFLLGLIFIMWGRRGPSISFGRKPARRETARPDFDDEAEGEGIPRRFVVYSHGVKIGQKADEYSDLLIMFSLKPGVSLQQIKVAYRNAVKTCHPDLNPNAGKEEEARFIKLTKTYERLVVLHAARTGER